MKKFLMACCFIVVLAWATGVMAQDANYTPYIVAGVLFVLLALPLIGVTDWVTLRAARRQSAGA